MHSFRNGRIFLEGPYNGAIWCLCSTAPCRKSHECNKTTAVCLTAILCPPTNNFDCQSWIVKQAFYGYCQGQPDAAERLVQARIKELNFLFTIKAKVRIRSSSTHAQWHSSLYFIVEKISKRMKMFNYTFPTVKAAFNQNRIDSPYSFADQNKTVKYCQSTEVV